MKTLFLSLFFVLAGVSSYAQQPVTEKPRILISTDIGGTDPDDNQSVAHFLMYSNEFDTEGLVSSPSYGSGSKEEILRMIDLYEKDLPKLSKHIKGLATPEYLRSITKQGRKGAAPYCGFRSATEGSDWIVKCARRKSDRPLWILVWGGLDDVAQALHDAPDIRNKIRVYWIGGPNKKWSVNSYAYIVQNFPDLWFIENNASYRGFITQNKVQDSYNAGFYDTYMKGAGNLGADFIHYYKGIPKLGDTPSLLYMMDGNPADPARESWGGSFEPFTHSSRIVFHRPATARDTIPVYSIIEFHVKGPVLKGFPADSACMTLTIGKQKWAGYYLGKGDYVVRHSTYYLGTLPYTIESDIPGFPRQEGAITVENKWPGKVRDTDYRLGANWYTDKSAPEYFWRNYQGAQTVYKWRKEVMEDWGKRLKYLKEDTESVRTDACLPAFPGAEGFGRYTTGGRGGKVYHVTTLEDGMQEGTLRYALSQTGPRTVVFDVAGTIFLNGKLRITNRDLTVAGQTAPGQGICIARYPVTIDADNVIVRYLRFRVGNEGGGEPDGLGSTDCKNVMVDHCSISWSVDECCSVYGGENLTVQWCLISESLRTAGHAKGRHGYGAIWGGARASFHHNLLAHHESRAPRLGPRPGTQEREYMDMRNNVIYNWAGMGCYGGEGMKVNIVNNYYKPGPATPKNSPVRYRIAGLGVRTTKYCYRPDGTPNVWQPMEHVWGKFYVDGNVIEGNEEVTRDNWTKGIYEQIDNSSCDNTFTEQVKKEMRLSAPLETGVVTTHSAKEAYRLVLQEAGCSKERDIIDTRIIEETRKGTATYIGSVTKDAGKLPGLIDLPQDVRPKGAASAWPELSDGGVFAADLKDTDGDGMPDVWEAAHRLNPRNAADGTAVGLSREGYTNLEVYLNSLIPSGSKSVQRLSARSALRETNEAFFRTEEARRIGDQVLAYQRCTGGWPKNIDMARKMSEEELAAVLKDKSRQDDSTIDNDATTMQMSYLAHLYRQTGEPRYREAFRRGVEYLLSGQYDNGGWPQFWPNPRGYQVHITYNDNAMVNTLKMIRKMLEAQSPYDGDLTDKALRKRLSKAFDKGIECILATQMAVNGELTVWCQQHDRETLEPAPARAFELPSYCSQESAAIVRLLMELPKPDARVKRAIHGAMKWFDKFKLTGLRYERMVGKEKELVTRLVEDTHARPIWARYYDLKYCEPFVCDRDGVPRRHLEEIGTERRNGYSWYNTSPAELFPLYDVWSARYDAKHKVSVSLTTPGANENGTIEMYRRPTADRSAFDKVVNPGESIQAAIEGAPEASAVPYKILIRKGTYNQKVIIDRPNIVLVGEDRDSTVIVLAETARTRAITEYHGRPVGNGVIVLQEGADDCVISGLTVYNNYGTTVENTTTHQMAIFGRATRTIVINCNVWADGNDALSLWARGGDGMYYHADLNLRCPGVDFLCPRGWCYATRCRFYGDGRAIIWHDGRGDKSKKLVITNSTFDAKSPTVLGRWHHDSQFFVVNCHLSEQILDSNISYAYTDKVLDPCPWGQRVYYYGCTREGGHSGWLKNNLEEAPGSPAFYGITALWTFDKKWNPEQRIRDLWPVLAYTAYYPVP